MGGDRNGRSREQARAAMTFARSRYSIMVPMADRLKRRTTGAAMPTVRAAGAGRRRSYAPHATVESPCLSVLETAAVFAGGWWLMDHGMIVCASRWLLALPAERALGMTVLAKPRRKRPSARGPPDVALTSCLKLV